MGKHADQFRIPPPPSRVGGSATARGAPSSAAMAGTTEAPRTAARGGVWQDRGRHLTSRTHRVANALAPLAGPIVIVAGVLVVLQHFAFGGLISRQYPDVLPFWLPTYCFLGKTLAAGHIAAWNPHVMGGVPFAADPQSGRMYAQAMALFSSLPCGTAIRWFVVANPLIAGLGMYAFLRAEGLARASSTVGGLALCMPLAGSYLLLNLPFAGTLAWTPVTLAAVARVLRATTLPGRLGWLVAASLAWMQIAASNLSDG